MSNISKNNKIFKSRKIILEQLKKRGYDVSEYENFSLNEIDILNQNNQLDMLIEEEESQEEAIQ